MFDLLFGWREASKCKTLIKKLQCRLKLFKNRRLVIMKHLKEDIVQLLKDGHDRMAYNRIEQLYMDENIQWVEEMLNDLCNFIILHLSYIRRHKDIPNDINEAIQTLVYASARCGNLPELMRLRELFSDRYGLLFVTKAVDLQPGNLVNVQVKEKLTLQCEVPEEVKNKMLDELVRDYLFKPGPLSLKYKPEFHHQQENAQTKTSTNCSIVLHSEYSAYYPEQSVINLDDVAEFRCPTKQDQRFFVFNVTSILCNADISDEFYTDIGNNVNTLKCIEWKYSEDGNQLYDDKKNRQIVKIDYYQSHENQVLTGEEVIADDSKEFQICEMEIQRDGVDVLRVLTESNGRRALNPKFVHPKLPDYDEITAKFTELKRVYQKTKCKS